MDGIQRLFSRPAAKPYRTRDVEGSQQPFVNEHGQLDFGPSDVENPKNWSKARRWYITIVGCILVLNATFASSGPSGCLEGIAHKFGVSMEATGLVTTLFLLGYCFGPLFWAPLSEFYGRRWIFYISFTLYLAFNFLCAFTNNFAGLLIGRFLTGTFASSALSNTPGVLADLWGPIERGIAMALFCMIVFIGPALGPIIGGFMELKENWRWAFYCLLWLGGATEIFLFTIPETFAPIILANKARRLRSSHIPGYENVKAPVESTDRTLAGIFKVALSRPWLLLFDPISFLVALYMGMVYALVYMLFTIYPIIFQEKRHWNSGVGELPLLGVIIGAVVGGALVLYNSSIDKKRMLAGRKLSPEDRLPITMLGGIVFFVSMFWFAWSGEYNSVHWIVPSLAGVFLSASILWIFVGFLNYLADTYLMFAASALAANTIFRSACGAAAPLFTKYMFDALGVGPGGSLIGGLAALLAPMPFLFYWKGESIRRRSRFAPTAGPPKVEHKRSDDEMTLNNLENVNKEKDEIGRSRRRSSTSQTDVASFRTREVEAGREGAIVDDAELRTTSGEIIESERDLERHQRYYDRTR